MAHLQRLIWFCLGVLLAAAPMLAFAAVGDAQFYGRNQPTVVYPSAVEACIAGDTRITQVQWLNYQVPPWEQQGNYAACEGRSSTGALIAQGWVTYVITAQCEIEGMRNLDGTCFTCPEGRTWNGTTCESPCQAKAGNSYGTSNSWAMLDVDTVPSGVPTFCDGQCSVSGGKVECESTRAPGSDGDFVSLGSTCTVQGPFTYTGQGCGPAGSAPQLVGVDDVQKPWWDKGLEQKDCSAQGGYWGNVNGIDACVRPQPGESFDKETSTGNESGTETETAPDGTTTEKQTSTSTECKDGKCTTTTTTTTTTKGADGQQIGDATTETKQQTAQEADFCKANPQHAQCAGTQTGGTFSGTCDKGFKCTGDAVQCAVAELAHVERCEALKIAEENALTDLAGEGWAGAADITAEEEARALNRDGAFDFDLGQTWLDSQQEYVTFTKECISVPPIEILGAHIEFDVGVLCDVGAVLRLFMHLLAYLGAIRMIVSKV